MLCNIISFYRSQSGLFDAKAVSSQHVKQERYESKNICLQYAARELSPRV